jgi:hypothetical protein
MSTNKSNVPSLEDKLFLEICSRQDREIELSDARPSILGGSFKSMSMSQIEYYLNYSKNTDSLKRQLRKEVGLFRYYFVYTFKFINAYNSYYYTRI